MRHKVSARNKFSGLATLALVSGMAGILVFSGNNNIGIGRARTGRAELLSVQPLTEDDGAMCQYVPATANSSLFASLQEERAARASASTEAKTEVAKRKPLRTLQDPYAAYSAVAVDPVHNEVIMTDENLFSILSYDRLENTPPGARMSEPKRMIRGMNAELEFQCALYVDPVNGDVYALNNDTLGKLVIFSREQKGDIAPARTLVTPPFTFGIAVDERNQEMMVTAQDDASVVTFHKSAKDLDSPLRTLQGEHTLLADPHGITLDSNTDLVYVANWGTYNIHKPGPDGKVIPFNVRDAGRTNWPISRNNSIPGSGDVHPPSINVYPREAKGDTPPLRVIQGPRTQLNWPTAVSVDSKRGELYVANDPTHSIVVFKADAEGDVAPIRVLKGPKTLIKNPTGVYYDAKNDELWVANFGNHTATVYNPQASGDTAPLRVIRSGPLNEPAPMMSNPHVVVYDSKRDQTLVAN